MSVIHIIDAVYQYRISRHVVVNAVYVFVWWYLSRHAKICGHWLVQGGPKKVSHHQFFKKSH